MSSELKFLITSASEHINNMCYPSAILDLTASLKLTKDDAVLSAVYHQLGICYIAIGDYIESEKFFITVTKVKSFEYINEAYVYLLEIYMRLQQFDKAEQIFTQHSSDILCEDSYSGNYLNFCRDLWIQDNSTDKAEIDAQRLCKFEFEPKISIVVPLYNTKSEYLVDLLDSVCEQTYSNWELCIADGNSSNKNLHQIIKDRAYIDSRIKYIFLDENKGVSENTNSAISLSSGDYISFMDHDDILEKNALYEVVKALNKDKELDLIYTDEGRMYSAGLLWQELYLKPDWSPSRLRDKNYIIHFVTVKKSLLTETGLLKKEFDALQDTELLHRITEKTDKIFHIPKVLYHWRRHEKQISNNLSSDDSYMQKALKMRFEYSKHLGFEINYVNSSNTEYSYSYRVPLNIVVSIIIAKPQSATGFLKVLSEVIKKSDYTISEIIVLSFKDDKIDLLNVYEKLKNNPIFKIITLSQNYEEFSDADYYNLAAQKAIGKYLVFIHHEVEILTDQWLQNLLLEALYPHMGVVGCRVNFLDKEDSIINTDGREFIGNNHISLNGLNIKEQNNNFFLFCIDSFSVCNVTSLTLACVLLKKDLFEKCKGFQPCFGHTFLLTDLCLSLREAGFYNVFTNNVTVNKRPSCHSHHNKVSDTFNEELSIFKNKWKKQLEKPDPFLNPNLSLINYEKYGCPYNIDFNALKK